MKLSLTKSGSMLLASMLLIAGCVNYPATPTTSPSTPASVAPSTPVASGEPATTPAPADNGKTRFYTKDVQPIMKTCSASSCHKSIPLGTYDEDKGISKASRSYMLSGLTDEQKKLINDWITAGTPNDTAKF